MEADIVPPVSQKSMAATTESRRMADNVNERRRQALAEVDNARFSYKHFRIILVAGSGFFTDAYDLFSANFITTLIGYSYFSGNLPASLDTAIKISTAAGTVIGQFGFGWLADRIGRKRMYGIELMFMIIGSIGQSIAGTGPSVEIVGAIIFWRVVMGIGVGGDYPLSSVITAEFATLKWRGAMMNAVFAMQGLGNFTAALIAFISIVGFKNSLAPANSSAQCGYDCMAATDKIWRIIVGFGTVPAVIALYFRLTIPETPRYTIDIGRDIEGAIADSGAYLSDKRAGQVDEMRRLSQLKLTSETLLVPKASWKDFWGHFLQWRYGKILLGTAGSWFFVDIAFYGLGLNNSIILGAIGYASSPNVYDNLYNVAVGNLVLAAAGNVPGYWVSVATIDTIGRKPIQLGSFIILTVLFCIIGFGFHKLSPNALFALYVLCQFFFNFGANSTTFVVPGEVFPTRYRSTAHGISAGTGKIGAVIAQALIGPLRNKGGTNKWLDHVMEIFALFMFAGVFTTLLIPETKRMSLEEISERYHGEIEYKPEEVVGAAEKNRITAS